MVVNWESTDSHFPQAVDAIYRYGDCHPAVEGMEMKLEDDSPLAKREKEYGRIKVVRNEEKWRSRKRRESWNILVGN